MTFIGSATAADSIYLDVYPQGIQIEESTRGNGFHSIYVTDKVGKLSVMNYAHGSGSLDSDVTLSSYEYMNRYYPVGADWVDKNTDFIHFVENNAMVYAPIRLIVGTGYYARKPMEYDSLIKDKTCLKGYSAITSIEHEIEYAHALDKELVANGEIDFNHTYDPEWKGHANIQMKINENITEGKVHIGILQGETDVRDPKELFETGSPRPSPFVAFKNRYNAIHVDENYWGTYHIERNITAGSPFYMIEVEDEWLPCPCGSVLDAIIAQPDYYKGSKGFGYNVRPIFDCTCPLIAAQAQFPRVYV